VITKTLSALSLVALLGGVILAVAGAGVIPGIVLIVLGLVLGALLGAIAAARRVRDSMREWRSLVSGGGPESVRVVSVEPPRGFIFNRDATVTLEVGGRGGTAKRVQRGIGVPIPQAFMWRMAGRIPTPFGRLTAARDLDVPLYRKRRA
jgi:hypothetical protein